MRQKWTKNETKMRQKLSKYCPKLVETPCRNLSLKVFFFFSQHDALQEFVDDEIYGIESNSPIIKNNLVL